MRAGSRPLVQFHFAPNEVLLQSLGIACGATTTPRISRALGGDWLVSGVSELSVGIPTGFILTLIHVSQQEALLPSPLYQEETEAGGRAPWVHTAKLEDLGTGA